MSVVERIPWQDRREVAHLIADHLDWQHRLSKGPGRLDVVGLSFADLKLHTLWLQKARFRECDFSRAYAMAANFNGASFEGCNFVECDGGSIELEKATIIRCDFSRSRIDGASFGGRLEDTRFDGADMSGVSFNKATLKGLDLSTANLPGATFTKSVVSGCDLRGRSFSPGRITDSELRNCDLRDVVWDNVGLKGTRFIECLFTPGGGVPRYVERVNLEGCRLDPDGEPLTDKAMRAALGW